MSSGQEQNDGVTEETAERILSLQRRCINCGGTYALQIHHRIFRSEGEKGLKDFLDRILPEYYSRIDIKLNPWKLNDIQNLCVLCLNCHEGQNGVGVHGGNEKLRQKLRNSFTDPVTGFNINLLKIKDDYLL
jgi:hypothetical protein